MSTTTHCADKPVVSENWIIGGGICMLIFYAFMLYGLPALLMTHNGHYPAVSIAAELEAHAAVQQLSN